MSSSTRLIRNALPRAAVALCWAAAFAQSFTRTAADLQHVPVSRLSLDNQGWIQTTTLVLTGRWP